jgi:small subunit ribosomal protein S29
MAAQFIKATASSNKHPLFRTAENNPQSHSSRHEGFFYTVSQADFDRWMSRGFNVEYYRTLKAFNETCLMVRSPAIDAISSLTEADYTAPNMRYVLYGPHGCGKSVMLAHVAHFCGRSSWFVAHVPWAAAYNRYYRDMQPSVFKPGRLDQPMDSADWLAYFRKMNEPLLLAKPDPPVTIGRYIWSKRETTEVGTPLTELIDFGLGRVKYASDVMGAVLKELRLQASEGQWRLLIAIDGVNALWSSTSIQREEDLRQLHPSTELTNTQHWLRMLQSDWTGGAVVSTVDSHAAHPVDIERYMPLELLGKDGFHLLDPFIPIGIPIFTEREAFSCIEYFRDRRWIQSVLGRTEDGRKELLALSGCNPHELYRVAINW